MTPSELNTAARQRYNAVDDDFWSDQELYTTIYQGCCEMATEGLVIEQTYQTVSVAGQQEYEYPTNALNIKRITYDGRKLDCITFREDDALTLINAATSATGSPTAYMIWNNIIYLRDIPGTDDLVIKVWANIEPRSVSELTTIEIPTEFHMALVNLLLSEMSAKDKNYQGAAYYRALWEKDLLRAKKFAARKKVGDAFPIVKNVDCLPQGPMGQV